MEKFPYVHHHYLDPNGKLEGKCCVCEYSNPKEDSYICEECNFYFCKNCAQRTDEEELKKFHSQHILEPILRYSWSCDICQECVYSSGLSMCCPDCNFDVCYKCFWGLNKIS